MLLCRPRLVSRLNTYTATIRRGINRGGCLSAKFFNGCRVRISADFQWAKSATGTVSLPPPQVIALGGPWPGGLTKQEVSALGTHTVYWVSFDEPQFDADGDGPYKGGQIWESALTLLPEN